MINFDDITHKSLEELAEWLDSSDRRTTQQTIGKNYFCKI